MRRISSNRLTINDRGRTIYLHYFMWYYNNKIDVDELCVRLRRLDRIINPHSKYYTSKETLDALMVEW